MSIHQKESPIHRDASFQRKIELKSEIKEKLCRQKVLSSCQEKSSLNKIKTSSSQEEMSSFKEEKRRSQR